MRETKKPAMAVFRLSEQLSRAADFHAKRAGITRTVLFTRAVANYLLDANAQNRFGKMSGDELDLIAKSALFSERCIAGEIDEKEVERLRELTSNAIDAANSAATASAALHEAQKLRKSTAKAIEDASKSD